MENFKEIMRFFRKFDQASTMRVFRVYISDFFDNLQLNRQVLDLDTMVITRYGEQEGVVRGTIHTNPDATRTIL